MTMRHMTMTNAAADDRDRQRDIVLYGLLDGEPVCIRLHDRINRGDTGPGDRAERTTADGARGERACATEYQR